MDRNPSPDWLFLAAVPWLLFVVAASVLFRLNAGKPLVPKAPAHALFLDTRASGRWASNCLLVAVTEKAVSVVPRFPFNLMFLPEIYGVERTIPVRDIRTARRIGKSGFGDNVAVDYGETELRLKVRDPQRFIDALVSLAVPTGP